MKVVYGVPPNYQRIVAIMKPPKEAIFCYGDTIYHQGDPDLVTPELHAHEQVHCDRQGDNPDGWWELYLTDPKFRLDEEIPAHQAEYQTYLKRDPPRHKRRRALTMIAKRLCGPLYGNLVSLEKAKQLVKG